MNNKFASLGTALSRDEAKKVMGGNVALVLAISDDGVSCTCKNGTEVGMASCDTCSRYCEKDHDYGGKESCS